jgi:hypothetical protein
MRLTPHKKAICFCVSSEQAIAMTKEFVDNGVSARYILSGSFDDDNTYSGKREQVFEDFHNNKFEVLVNISISSGEQIVSLYSTVSLFPQYDTTTMLLVNLFVRRYFGLQREGGGAMALSMIMLLSPTLTTRLFR